MRGYLPHAGTVEGTISSIRWHEANLKKVRGAHVKAGYKRSVEIDDTNEIDGLVPVWDPQPASLLDAGSEENSVQLPFYSPLPDDYEPSGYDIEFVLEVQGDRPRGAGQ